MREFSRSVRVDILIMMHLLDLPLSPQQTVPGYPGGGNGVSRKDWPKPIG
jgi:hypothetical protein